MAEDDKKSITTVSRDDDDKRFDRQLRDLEEQITSTENAIQSSLDKAFRSFNTIFGATGSSLSNVVQTLFDEGKNWSETVLPDSVVGKSDLSLDDATEGILWNPFEFGRSQFRRRIIREGKTPNGVLWAYPIPSVDLYDACKEMKGVGLWNREGVWKCLFPNAGTGAAGYVDMNKTDEYGKKYFSTLEELLGWKSEMKKVIRQENLKRLQKLQEQKAAAEKEAANVRDPNEKRVVGTSVSTEYKTLPDGSVYKKEIRKKWLDDGTCETVENEDTKPPGSVDSPFNGNVNWSVFESDDSDSGKGKGWFWK